MKQSRSSALVSSFLFLQFLFTLGLVATAEDRGLGVVAREVVGRDDFDIGRQYAVIIGIDRYKEWPALRSAVSEARSIRRVLGERYFIDEFFELYDEDATASNIRRLFVDTLPKKIGARDSLLVFYAGHGQLDATKTGFWIAVDGTTDAYSQDKWIPNNQLRNMIGGLKAQRILILADACFSGDFLNVSRGASPVIDSAYYRRALQLTARQVLTSGASESVPDESEYGKQLLNILERNDQSLLDPVSMYERLRLGVKKTLPLLGSMPGNEDGASFVLFLKSGGAATVTATNASQSGGKPADLLVRASETGAEILVDGVSRGKSPLLVSALPSGRNIRIEARTGLACGAAEISLAPGELRELSVAMAVRTGNLVIGSNEVAVRVIFDGNDRGALGSGILRDLPVGAHKLELVGQDLYYAATVIVPPEATAQLAAQVQAIGSLAITIPADATIDISSGGQSRTQRGSGVVANLPVGSYTLSAVGGDWLPATTTVTITKGQQSSWEPWKEGSIAFTVSPPNVICLLEDGSPLETTRTAVGIAPGNYKAVLRKPGYRDREISVAVAVGKATPVKATLEKLSPGAVTLAPLGTDIELEVEGRSLSGSADKTGALVFRGIPAGYPVLVKFRSRYAVELAVPDQTITLGEGETVKLELPSGRIGLPWISPDATIAIATTRLPSSQAGGGKWISEPLPIGTYKVEVEGTVTYSTAVQIKAGTITELPGYRDAAVARLASLRTKSSASLSGRRTQSTLGIVSLGVGILSAAGAGAVYFLGNQAMTSYLGATDTATSTTARKNVELYQGLLVGAGAVGGLGLGLSPILLLTGPDPRVLQKSIDALDEGIRALEK